MGNFDRYEDPDPEARIRRMMEALGEYCDTIIEEHEAPPVEDAGAEQLILGIEDYLKERHRLGSTLVGRFLVRRDVFPSVFNSKEVAAREDRSSRVKVLGSHKPDLLEYF